MLIIGRSESSVFTVHLACRLSGGPIWIIFSEGEIPDHPIYGGHMDPDGQEHRDWPEWLGPEPEWFLNEIVHLSAQIFREYVSVREPHGQRNADKIGVVP